MSYYVAYYAGFADVVSALIQVMYIHTLLTLKVKLLSCLCIVACVPSTVNVVCYALQ
jgi:hypothetical protein